MMVMANRLLQSAVLVAAMALVIRQATNIGTGMGMGTGTGMEEKPESVTPVVAAVVILPVADA
jgi:hypothetical protein